MSRQNMSRSGVVSPSAQDGPVVYGERAVLNQVPFPRVHSVVRVRPWTEKEAKTVPERQVIPRPGLELGPPDEDGFRTSITVLDPANRFKPKTKGKFECDTVLWSFVDETVEEKTPASVASVSFTSPTIGAETSVAVDRPAPAVPASQADVYAHAGAPLVDCLVMGYNVGLIVNGASNTEQQYTLWGDEYWAGDPRGIIPRFLFDLFERQQKAYREDLDSKIELEVYAIHGEQIADMLRKTKVKPGEDALKVREDAEGIHVIGGTRMLVEDVLSLEAPLKTAIQKYNKNHSSDHLVICIRLTDIWTFADPENPEAQLKKQRLSTATFVLQNGSHLVFQRCLDAAINRDSGEAPQAKVPSRDSNFTRIISDLFGGNCNVTYVHCVSPYYEHTKDAMTTLAAASKVAVIKCRSVQNTDNSMAELRKLDDEVRTLAAASAKENDTIMVVQNELDRRAELLREKQQVAADVRAALENQEQDRDEKEKLLRSVSEVRMKHQHKNMTKMEQEYNDKVAALEKEEKEIATEAAAIAEKNEALRAEISALEASMAAGLAKTADTKTEIAEHQAFEEEVHDQEHIVADFAGRQDKLKEKHEEKLAQLEEEKVAAHAETEKAQEKQKETDEKRVTVKKKHDELQKLLDEKRKQDKMLETQLEEERKIQKECDDLDEEIKKLQEEKKNQGCCVVM